MDIVYAIGGIVLFVIIIAFVICPLAAAADAKLEQEDGR